MIQTRLAEILAALSLATDLGAGFPPEKTLRNTLIALAIADELGLDRGARSDLYYASLLRYVGCTGFAYEGAQIYRDEFAAIQTFAGVDEKNLREVAHAMFAVGKGQGPAGRVRAFTKNLRSGKAFGEYVVRADCEVTARFARRFGLAEDVAVILEQPYERWDGKGGPRKLEGEALSIGARVMAVAQQAEVSYRTDGPEAATAMARARSGGWFDPRCVTAFERVAPELFRRLEAGSVWDEALATEPQPFVHVTDEGIDDLARGFADFVDLKSPFFLGHSGGVADLAAGAARSMGLADDETTTLRRAALVHDLGRVTVSNSVWDKRGPLSASEWELVRLHAYHGERVLARSPALAPIAAIAGLHHERLDGSGYHRGVGAAAMPMAARILAAADCFQALTSERPHRPASEPDRAAEALDAEVAAGRLDPDAAGAVYAAAGVERRAERAARPAGLTEREVEVLRLLAKGLSKREIAERLVIAPGTVHTHTVHIYEKAGVSTRAGVALFAMENGLLAPEMHRTMD